MEQGLPLPDQQRHVGSIGGYTVETIFGYNSAVVAIAISAVTFGLLVGGSVFTILHMRRLASAPASPKRHRPAQRLISIIFPDLFPVEEAQPARPRVLCTNRSAERLEVMKGLLENEGFEVWTARDIRDGLELLTHVHFEAIVAENDSIDRQELRRIHEVQAGLPVLAPSGDFVVAVDTYNPALAEPAPGNRVGVLAEMLASQVLS
jgi:hypothetical protein